MGGRRILLLFGDDAGGRTELVLDFKGHSGCVGTKTHHHIVIPDQWDQCVDAAGELRQEDLPPEGSTAVGTVSEAQVGFGVPTCGTGNIIFQ